MRIGWGLVALGLAGLGTTGCHSAFVDAVVKNQTGAAVSLVEVDYPSASFGKETLAAGAEYHYRFKVQGDGPLKVLWTDAAMHDHTVVGPGLKEGDEGGFAIVIKPSGVDWDSSLKKR